MLSKLRFATLLCFVVTLTVFVTGCGDKPPETLPGHPVKGKVTVNGKEPGTYANLEFVSVANPSESGGGNLDPAGNFSGRVPLGKCKVALKIGSGGGPPGGSSGGNPYGKGGSMTKGPTGPPPGAGGNSGGAPALMKGAEIPKKFQDVKTSGMEVDVVEGKDLNIDFK